VAITTTAAIDQIKRLIKEGKAYHDVVILYRFYQDLGYLKEELSDNGIPFEICGDKSKRDRPFVLTVFALIKIIEQRTIHEKDWRTVLTKLDYIGKRKADKIIAWLTENKESPITQYPGGYKYTEHVNGLLQFIRSIRTSEQSNTTKLKRIMNYVARLPKVNRSIKDHIRPTLLKLANETSKLSDIIERYNDRSYPLCYPPVDEPPYPDSYVRLSTVHRIKGGGLDTVFYLGTDDTLFEKYGSFETYRKREAELQLMNVAVSRAKRELHLLFPMDKRDWRQRSPIQNPWTFIANIADKHYGLNEL
jgi:DNA helicase-2/ATP-dependent DNA helicase PcrA